MIDLHIIQNEKITSAEIRAYRQLFTAENHPFVIWGGSFVNDYSKCDNVEMLDENLKGAVKLLQRMKRADRIHIHGLFSFWLLGILATHKRVGEKVVWYIWGDDLYSLMRPKKTVYNTLHLWLRKKACSHVSYIATNIKGDYRIASRIIKRDYKFFELRFSKDYVSGILPYVDGSYAHDGINILVGNSATPTNFHIEAFEKLSRYKHENIKVYVPLSYGSKAYAEQVIAAGKRIFGDKFCPLTEFMPKDEYFRFLMSIDVAVFANDRQRALGNIMALLYAGKKVYMRSDISSWETLHEEYGIEISEYSWIDTEEFSAFSANEINMDVQRHIMDEMINEDKVREAISAAMISESGK